jgi:hypothetical protein
VRIEVAEEVENVGEDRGAAQDGVRCALELYELAERMLEQRLRREHPEWSLADVDAEIERWLLRRPGAEFGDGVGRPVAWPRLGLRSG